MSDTERLNVEISGELNEELDKLLPWGTKSAVVRSLLQALVNQISAGDSALLGHTMRDNILIIKIPSDSDKDKVDGGVKDG